MSASIKTPPAAPKVAVLGTDKCPDIYFDGVHALGELSEIYQLELFTARNIPLTDGRAVRRNVAVVGLRCTRAGLLQLITCAQKALEMGEAAIKARAEANGRDT